MKKILFGLIAVALLFTGGTALAMNNAQGQEMGIEACPITERGIEIQPFTCAITHWFINASTPYRPCVGCHAPNNIPANTRITRLYSTSGSYTNIRVACDASIPASFRCGSGWVLSARVSAFRPNPPCVAPN